MDSPTTDRPRKRRWMRWLLAVTAVDVSVLLTDVLAIAIGPRVSVLDPDRDPRLDAFALGLLVLALLAVVWLGAGLCLLVRRTARRLRSSPAV